MPLDPIWTIYDPLGDSTIDQVAGDLSIIIPAGTAHENLDSPRILQTCTDTDFVIEIRIDADPVSDKQSCGIVAEQDHNNLIMASIASGYFVEVVGIVAGVPSVLANVAATPTFPQWLKLERVGDDWTAAISDDGVLYSDIATVTQAFTIAKAGIFAATAGANPAWNALVDIFIADGISPYETFDIIETISVQDFYTATMTYNTGVEETITISDSFDATVISTKSVRWRYVEFKDMTSNFIEYKPPVIS